MHVMHVSRYRGERHTGKRRTHISASESRGGLTTVTVV